MRVVDIVATDYAYAVQTKCNRRRNRLSRLSLSLDAPTFDGSDGLEERSREQRGAAKRFQIDNPFLLTRRARERAFGFSLVSDQIHIDV